eukprot:g28426.t1
MMSAFTGPLPACHFRSWASDWRSVRLGCSAVGEKSKVHWKLLKYQLHRCLTNRSSCDVSELLGALLPGARGDERSDARPSQALSARGARAHSKARIRLGRGWDAFQKSGGSIRMGM